MPLRAGFQPLHWILWNLLLAAIPVFLGIALEQGISRFSMGKRKRIPLALWLPLGLVWFVFLPNTCYLLTEWRHFLFDPPFEAMRDTALVRRDAMVVVAKYGLLFLLYSGFGIVCFALAVRPIDHLMRRMGVRRSLFAVPFFLLVSLGVYMGLNIRLNSWDVVTRPAWVLRVAEFAFQSPVLIKTILAFAILLWIAYVLIDVWCDGAALRLQHKKGR